MEIVSTCCTTVLGRLSFGFLTLMESRLLKESNSIFGRMESFSTTTESVSFGGGMESCCANKDKLNKKNRAKNNILIPVYWSGKGICFVSKEM